MRGCNSVVYAPFNHHLGKQFKATGRRIVRFICLYACRRERRSRGQNENLCDMFCRFRIQRGNTADENRPPHQCFLHQFEISFTAQTSLGKYDDLNGQRITPTLLHFQKCVKRAQFHRLIDIHMSAGKSGSVVQVYFYCFFSSCKDIFSRHGSLARTHQHHSLFQRAAFIGETRRQQCFVEMQMNCGCGKSVSGGECDGQGNRRQFHRLQSILPSLLRLHKAKTLKEAAKLAVKFSYGQHLSEHAAVTPIMPNDATTQRFLRRLYIGGTFCNEA